MGSRGERWYRTPDIKPVDVAVRDKARGIVGDAWFRDTTADRLAYGRDCWPLGILWARGGKVTRYNPDFVAIPGSLEEVVELVALARDSGTPIVPYGAGSGVCGGTLPVQGGFVLDAKRLDRIVRIDREALTARVGAGIIGMHLEAALNRRDLTMGHWPSSLICSSLGGYLAGRSAGQLSSRFGKIEDMCLSLQAVAGTAEVIETSHFQPDLTQLMIGSEGTLGVITEATMRVEPRAEEYIYRGFELHTVEAALDVVRRMIQAGFRPSVVRLYDAFDSLLAKRKRRRAGHDGDEEAPESLITQLAQYVAERIGPPFQSAVDWAAKGLLRRALGSPMWLNRLVDRLPVGVLLIVGFEGASDLTRAEADAALEMLRQEATDLGAEPGEHWRENRFNVSYKMSPMFDLGAFTDTMEVSTTWDNLSNLYRTVRAALAKNAFVMAHFSHVYPEGSSIYFTFAGFAEDGEPIEALYERTWSVALNAVRRAGGSVAHHHGAGLSKGGHLNADHRGGAPLNARLKARFDPAGVMNPGKLWDVPQVRLVDPPGAPAGATPR